MLRRGGYKRVAILYQDDEFGLDIIAGSEAALKAAGQGLVERASYKRGATDFSAQMARLKAANPDLIVLATVVRETIGAMGEARKLGYAGDFFGSQGSYLPVTPRIGGKAVDGLYNVSEIPAPYRDDPGNSRLLNDWMDGYKARFGSEADLGAVFGWIPDGHGGAHPGQGRPGPVHRQLRPRAGVQHLCALLPRHARDQLQRQQAPGQPPGARGADPQRPLGQRDRLRPVSRPSLPTAQDSPWPDTSTNSST